MSFELHAYSLINKVHIACSYLQHFNCPPALSCNFVWVQMFAFNHPETSAEADILSEHIGMFLQVCSDTKSDLHLCIYTNKTRPLQSAYRACHCEKNSQICVCCRRK